MFVITNSLLVVSVFLISSVASAEQILKEFVDLAVENNFALKAEVFETRAAEKKANVAYTLESPRVGISRLSRGSETSYWTISQKIDFPSKYYLKGKAQKVKSQYQKARRDIKVTEVRAKCIEVLYEYYANRQSKILTESNLRLVKDAARTAEKRYATRSSTQSDSMKAHFEITKLELKLLKINEKRVEILAKLTTLLGGSSPAMKFLENMKLNVPELMSLKVRENQKSPHVGLQEFNVEEARLKKYIAIGEFAPDIQVQYQQRYSGLPEDSSIFSINASIPLWFWSEASELSSKTAHLKAEESRLAQTRLEIENEKISLSEKIRLKQKALSIYKTTLLPQAEGAFITTQKAYSAGTIRFLDLLDSERSFIQVKFDFYNELVEYVRMIVYFETLFGVSISNLYFVGGSQ